MNTNFSEDKIKQLNINQTSGLMHPYTCCGPEEIYECLRNKASIDRSNGMNVPYTNENEGILIATKQGWVCPCGKYTQDWYH